MQPLSNHPGMSLEPGAAASLERLEASHGVVPINSAYRPESEQQALIDRWYRGGTYNRPPYLYKPREPASAGLHVSGRAIDTTWASSHRALMAEYGFMFNYAYDVVHLEYERQHDQHINDVILVNKEEDDMTPEQDARLKNIETMLGYLQNAVGDKKKGLAFRLGVVYAWILKQK